MKWMCRIQYVNLGPEHFGQAVRSMVLVAIPVLLASDAAGEVKTQLSPSQQQVVESIVSLGGKASGFIFLRGRLAVGAGEIGQRPGRHAVRGTS